MTSSSKRKSSGSDGGGHAKRKRHKNEELVDGRSADAEDDDESDGDGDLAAERDTNSRMPKQRVTTKGNNVPERIDTFEELRDRYRIHSQLMDNLGRDGYKHPTGIQSAGCPILLEVRGPIVLRWHSADSRSLAIWPLYPLRAQERHYPISYQSCLCSRLRYRTLRPTLGKAFAQLFWLQLASWHIRSITSA